MELKIIQINLQHSKAASANLVYLLRDRQYDVALVQEPWVNGGRIKGLNLKEYELFKTTNVDTNSNFRTCILAKKQINLFFLTKYSNPDQTTVKLERDGLKPLVLTSTYMPYDGIEGPPAVITEELVKHAKANRWDIILGCDSNSHHVIWGSSDTNNRGESLFDYILQNNLLITNKGNEPTFVTRNRKEVLDITIVNNSNTLSVENWKVLKEESFSDHKMIEFSIPITNKITKKPFRNIRNTNWEIFKREVEMNLRDSYTESIHEPKHIDSSIEIFTEIMNKALEKSCPLKSLGLGKRKPQWWTNEINSIRKETRRLFNVAKRTRNETDWDNYKSSQRKFKAETQRAKRSSWTNFCSNITCTNETARLRKILAKEPIPLSSLREPNGNWTESSKETLELLVNTHFPGCKANNETEISTYSENTIPDDIVTIERIRWAIDSFSPYKSPGLDGIYPVMLQKCEELIIYYLEQVFLNSLKWGYLPKMWHEVKVVFIPKAGKPSHINAKDYRPISLTSFVLKTFERLIDIYIRSKLDPEVISSAQHAYTKGKSVETALHCVVSTIEKTLHNKEYTLAAFLDIEGAFNNIQNNAIELTLLNLEVDNTIIKWIMCMLKNRQIFSELAGIQINVSTSRGTPQGGVLSPLLWILVMNDILNKLKYSGVKAIAYADDLALLATGKFLTTINEQLENALSKVCTWTGKSGLAVNPSKTELVLFTNKRKIPDFSTPRINGQSLTISDHAKYLGVILDRKLNWGKNIKERANKATIAFYACNRIFGRSWGPNPKTVRWMYTAIVRPILSYGNLVWWNALDKKTNTKILTKIQRIACIGITGVMRTTPTAGLEAILNLKPIDLHIQELAANSALRLNQTSFWKNNQIGHAKILQKFTGSNTPTDYMSPILDFNKTFTTCYPDRSVWMNNEPYKTESSIAIYTDGSKMNTGVGAGFFSETLNLASSFRLPDNSSVFQAEVLAVTNAAKHVSMKALPHADITFFIDSQAAIKAISATVIKSKLVSCCREELKVLGLQHNIRLCWVPGHSDVPGNERADELARKGSLLAPSQIDTTIKIPTCVIKQIISKQTLVKTNERWNLLDTCAITKKIWPKFDKDRTDKIINLDKRSLRTLVSIITGHNLLGYHKMKMGLSSDDLCRGCDDENEHENTTHFLCHCPALCHIRNKNLGKYFFSDLEELSNHSGVSLLNYTKASKWLELTPNS